jgi:cellulase
MPDGASSASPKRLLTTPPHGPTIQREWKQLHPIRELDSKFMACNSPGTPGKLSAPVKAGGSLTAYWSKWPHMSGPVTVYMAECGGDCAAIQPTSLDWFKIYHVGLVSGTTAHGKWGATEMIKNNNSLTTRIPMLKPGNYMIRHETIVRCARKLTTTRPDMN